MQKRFSNLLLVSIAALLALSSCGSSPTSDPYSGLDIDPSITGEARKIIGDYMLTLSPEDREYVVLQNTDGKLYSNRTQLTDIFSLYTATQQPGVYRNDKGVEIQSLILDKKPEGLSGQTVDAGALCNKGGSGPFRRVYSNPGYSWQSAYVYLPTESKSEILEDKTTINPSTNVPYGDTGYIYMGGWGSNGGAVDAGFQHGKYTGSTNDDWAPIIVSENPISGQDSVYTLSPDKNSNNAPFRMKAGQEVFFKFYVTSAVDSTDGKTKSFVNMSAQGMPNFDTTVRTTTFGKAMDDKFGWNVSGGTNILKRMTTIGQKKGENLNTNSFIKNVAWRGSMIGTSSTNATKWSSTATGGFCSYPSSGTSSISPNGNKLYIQYTDQSQEIDAIYLKP